VIGLVRQVLVKWKISQAKLQPLPSFGPTLFLGSDLFCTVGVPRIAPQVGHLILLQNPSPFQRASQQ